jgi:hypothetical protein
MILEMKGMPCGRAFVARLFFPHTLQYKIELNWHSLQHFWQKQAIQNIIFEFFYWNFKLLFGKI